MSDLIPGLIQYTGGIILLHALYPDLSTGRMFAATLGIALIFI